MNDSFKLAMQLTMVDMLSGAAQVVRKNILNMGTAGKEVQRNFDIMTTHISRGLKTLSVTNYGIQKIKPGIRAAADLQEATLDVKMNLMESGQNAGDLARQLATVRAIAIDIQKQMPFGATEVMGIENVLLKAGLKMEDVTAKSGAAWAASALATISKEAPQAMGEGLIAMSSPFNLRGGQYGEIANFLQKVDQASVTTIPELVEGMKYVSGTAANMKVSWQDTLHAMGVMSQQGLRGSMAGTSLNDFLIRMVGTSRIERRVLAALNQDLKRKGKSPLEFFDGGGKLKALPAIINNLRTSLDGLNDKTRMFVLQKIFGEQGARAAFALIHEGAGSWEEVGQGIAKAADMQAKLTTRMEGFNANLRSLQTTSKTTAASFFAPWLGPLDEITKKANEAMGKLGKFAEEHPKTTDTINGTVAAGVATLGGYAVYNQIKGGAYGLKVLKGLKGISSTALGVAEGKAIQAATGVQPVFVVNMPGGGFGGLPGVGGSEGDFVGPMPQKPLAWFRRAIPMLAGASAGQIGLALGVGYASGTGINAMINHMTRQATNGKYETWGARIYDALHSENNLNFSSERQINFKEALKNDIKLEINIDSKGIVVTRSNDMSTNITTIKRGNFFDALMGANAM